MDGAAAPRPGGPPALLVAGLGTAGLRVVELLVRSGVRVSGIDARPDATALRAAVTMGFAVSVGDARDPAVLRRAGIEGATALLVLINDDAMTLRVGLAARAICPDVRIVLRIFSHTTLDHLPPGARLEGRSLSELAAPTFVAATLLPSLCGSFALGETQYGVAQAAAPAGGQDQDAAGVRLRARDGDVVIAALDSLLSAGAAGTARALPWHRRLLAPVALWAQAAAVGWRRSNRLLRRLLLVLVVGIAVAVLVFATAGHLAPLQALYFVVSTVTTVGYGDISVLHDTAPLVTFDIILMLGGALLMAIVYAFITDLVVGAKLERSLGLRAATRRNHVVIVGLGSVGYRCALALKERGIPVVLVDRDEHGRYGAAAQAAGLPVLLADAQSEDALRRAGIDHARALLCATSSDQVNVETGLLGRGVRPDLHVVLRVFDPVFADQVQRQLGLSATFSAAVLAAPGFAAAALAGSGILMPPPAELPGVPDVLLSLRCAPRPTTVAALCEAGTVPLAIVQGDGCWTTAPLPTRAVTPADRLLLAVLPPDARL